MTFVVAIFAVLATAAAQDTGNATYYADYFHGKKASDGTLYHRDSMTCAHKTYPFGTVLRVRNKKNGNEVYVTVTDRGPFRRGCIVDLSRAAAEQLDMIASGVVPVEVELVEPVVPFRNIENTILPSLDFDNAAGKEYFSLAQDIGVPVYEAKEYIETYFERFPGIRRYMDEVVAQAKERGYVETLMHRRRALPELAASNFNTRSFGERVARNMPIQGTAADVIKLAMVRVDERLHKENLKAKLILQVHDELIVECPEEEKETVARLLTEEMEGAVHLSVPLTAEAHWGKNWLEAK